MNSAASNDALSTREQVEQLADALSACADALHTRIMREIKDGKLGLDPARTLFEDEVLLRERANALYAQAATLAVGGLGTSQQKLLGLTNEAKDKIQRVQGIANAAALASSLLGLAGAALTGKPQGIVRALEGVYHASRALGATGD